MPSIQCFLLVSHDCLLHVLCYCHYVPCNVVISFTCIMCIYVHVMMRLISLSLCSIASPQKNTKGASKKKSVTNSLATNQQEGEGKGEETTEIQEGGGKGDDPNELNTDNHVEGGKVAEQEIRQGKGGDAVDPNEQPIENGGIPGVEGKVDDPQETHTDDLDEGGKDAEQVIQPSGGEEFSDPVSENVEGERDGEVVHDSISEYSNDSDASCVNLTKVNRKRKAKKSKKVKKS